MAQGHKTNIKKKPIPVKKNTEQSSGNSWMKWLILAGILILAYIIYAPVTKSNFINYDDDYFVVLNKNLHQPLGDCFSFFTKFWRNDNYNSAPILMMAYSIEYHFWDLNPNYYHTVNLYLHLINIIIVFWFIFLLSGRKWDVA